MPTMLPKNSQSVPKATETEWELEKASAIRAIRRPASVAADDPRTTPDVISSLRRELAKAGIQHLSAIIENVNELFENPYVDEFGKEIKTTKHAYDICCDMLIDAAISDALARSQYGTKLCIPEATVSSDERGGIRVEWVRENASVHFVIPKDNSSEPYVYTEVGDKYGTKTATSTVLAESLRNIA